MRLHAALQRFYTTHQLIDQYRGLAKSTANLISLFALSNLWMVRKRLLHLEALG